MSVLKSVVVPVGRLSIEQIRVMYCIMEEYYDNIDEDTFARDLGQKRDAVLLFDERSDIQGFTTLAVFLPDERTQLLYSGDTIVKKQYWNHHDLAQAWLANALSYAENFDGATYWLLLTKGYKTYKYLHRFFNEFYPRVDIETPAEMQSIMDEFAQRQYGDAYRDGIYAAGKDYLKSEYAHIDSVAARDKNTAYFLERNPGYKDGDEMVCLCEISAANLSRAGRWLLG